MEDYKKKKVAGRPKIYLTEEERINAIKQAKIKYSKNTDWYCDLCNNNVNYKMWGRTNHKKTQKHNAAEVQKKMIEYENNKA